MGSHDIVFKILAIVCSLCYNFYEKKLHPVYFIRNTSFKNFARAVLRNHSVSVIILPLLLNFSSIEHIACE